MANNNDNDESVYHLELFGLFPVIYENLKGKKITSLQVELMCVV